MSQLEGKPASTTESNNDFKIMEMLATVLAGQEKANQSNEYLVSRIENIEYELKIIKSSSPSKQSSRSQSPSQAHFQPLSTNVATPFAQSSEELNPNTGYVFPGKGDNNKNKKRQTMYINESSNRNNENNSENNNNNNNNKDNNKNNNNNQQNDNSNNTNLNDNNTNNNKYGYRSDRMNKIVVANAEKFPYRLSGISCE